MRGASAAGSSSGRVSTWLCASVRADSGDLREYGAYLHGIKRVVDGVLPPEPGSLGQPQIRRPRRGQYPVRATGPAGQQLDLLDPLVRRCAGEPLDPPSQVRDGGEAGGFGVVASGMGGDQVVQAVVGMAGPGEEVVDVPLPREPVGAVEALQFLCLGEWSPDPVEADPPGPEEKVGQAVCVDQIRVLSGDPGGPFRVDQGPDEGREPDQPVTNPLPQPE